jgi:hypothetical protein
MSLVEVEAWKCDRVECGHVWYTGSEEKPKACARCKSRAWDKGGDKGEQPKPEKMIIESRPREPAVKAKPTPKPQPALSIERCPKPDHLVFKNGDSWVCMTCKKEQ